MRKVASAARIDRLDLDYRFRSGDTPTRDEYDNRFPGEGPLIDCLFEELSESDGSRFNRDRYDSAAETIPQTIGEYTIRGLLGTGGFGCVYLAHDDQLDRLVAIKVPRRDRIGTDEDIEAYLAEARMAAGLDHPAIVPVYHVGQTEDQPFYVVSKFIEGRDLRHVIKECRPSHGEAARIVATVADALHYTHQQRLVHQDVKPSNILLDAIGEPYVTDFGLALKEEIGQRFRHAGTPIYMSPEQARGEGHRVDGRSDGFSLGVVLYELLTGRHPFAGDESFELAQSAAAEESGQTQQATKRPEYEVDRRKGDRHRSVADASDGCDWESRGSEPVSFAFQNVRHVQVERILDNIRTRRPSGPRELDQRIPEELERICLRSLAKKLTDRYANAKDFSADLRDFLEARLRRPAAPGSVAKSRSDDSRCAVVPKGLRSFDAADVDFFLQLLPGPRDRDGLPECIRFWKHRVEETNLARTCPVGLIYGPSGCGKSSLVKAGLLPRLDDHVATVYVEATGDETEACLLNQLRGMNSVCGSTDEASVLREGAGVEFDRRGLTESLAAVRQGAIPVVGPSGSTVGVYASRLYPRTPKVLLVLDQFEQWLHAHTEPEKTELVRALRQCDGGRLQCLILVREDFWMATTRFMQALEIPLREGENSAAVDLFDLAHARKVLADFGRAYGRLSDASIELTKQQTSFLSRAVCGLSRDGRVIPVRLALFAEMMKTKPWTPSSLKAVGGTEGVGVAYLEETFSGPSATREHRGHQQAMQAILKTLLPSGASSIKGHTRSYDELLEVSGYVDRRRDFDQVIDILDHQTRLLTPVDTHDRSASDPRSARGSDSQKQYQLTHDYLVPSLRKWLTRKQRETRRGRAELRLNELSTDWNVRRSNQNLPAWWELLSIVRYTRTRDWTQPQRRMMVAAKQYYMKRGGSSLAVAIMLLIGVVLYAGSLRRASYQQRASDAVELVLTVPADGLPHAIQSLQPLKEFALPLLRDSFEDQSAAGYRRLRAAFGLSSLGDNQLDFLLDGVASVSESESSHLVAALREKKNEAIRHLYTRQRKTRDAIVRARVATILLCLGDYRAAEGMLRFATDPIDRSSFIRSFQSWHGDLSMLPCALESCDDAAWCSGMSAAVGAIPLERFSAPARERLLMILLRWYLQSPDSATHSAAGWALKQWNQTLPEIARSERPRKGFSWYVNRSGMTMVRLPAGTYTRPDDWASPRYQQVTLTRPFYICDREVSMEEFEQFRSDDTYPMSDKPTDRGEFAYVTVYNPVPDSPVHTVNWVDAVLFCNWLSHKEGLTPCYAKRTDVDPQSADFPVAKVWSCDLGANGYRLPTEAEWEYACRANTTTAYYFGDDVTFLSAYAVLDRSHPDARGTKLPNAWGLFDMHGNVREWCHDWFGPFSENPEVIDPTGPSTGEHNASRGGGIHYYVVEFQSNGRKRQRGSHRENDLGFRVVRNAERL